jgi:hypothetical protein
MNIKGKGLQNLQFVSDSKRCDFDCSWLAMAEMTCDKKEKREHAPEGETQISTASSINRIRKVKENSKEVAGKFEF